MPEKEVDELKIERITSEQKNTLDGLIDQLIDDHNLLCRIVGIIKKHPVSRFYLNQRISTVIGLGQPVTLNKTFVLTSCIENMIDALSALDETSHSDVEDLIQENNELKQQNEDLRRALNNIKTLSEIVDLKKEID